MQLLSRKAVGVSAGTLAVVEMANTAAASNMSEAIDDSITTFVPLVVTLILVGIALAALMHFRK